jgi:amino acid transporter
VGAARPFGRGAGLPVLFGYLWRAHIEPGLQRRKKKVSGLAVLAVLGVLFATVPGLFYLTGETARAATAAVHTWLGAAALAPFLYHLYSKRV